MDNNIWVGIKNNRNHIPTWHSIIITIIVMEMNHLSYSHHNINNNHIYHNLIVITITIIVIIQ